MGGACEQAVVPLGCVEVVGLGNPSMEELWPVWGQSYSDIRNDWMEGIPSSLVIHEGFSPASDPTVESILIEIGSEPGYATQA